MAQDAAGPNSTFDRRGMQGAGDSGSNSSQFNTGIATGDPNFFNPEGGGGGGFAVPFGFGEGAAITSPSLSPAVVGAGLQAGGAASGLSAGGIATAAASGGGLLSGHQFLRKVVTSGLGTILGIYGDNKARKDAKKQQEAAFLFSPEERAAARQLLMQMLFRPPATLSPVPSPGTQGVPRGATPQQMQFAQFMKMVQDRYSRPTPEYQGYLQSLQERRDARGGVPGVPPQGASSPSAQRRVPAQSAGGRSY